ncbi:hypothetical protein [Bacillus sp. LL01]|uniref:hypothetical protein n=1 Tax=Bacillus sp. LL01 TaxID=1665556 RepID=UPI000A673FCA|nr:hypothetical protein [Bacillus sp. LL01]
MSERAPQGSLAGERGSAYEAYVRNQEWYERFYGYMSGIWADMSAIRDICAPYERYERTQL